MEKFIAEYLLYIYLRFIKNDDIDDVKNFYKPFMRKLIFFHDVYVWILSILFFPILIIGMKIESSNMMKKIENIYLNQK